jgi:hypothetical protein
MMNEDALTWQRRKTMNYIYRYQIVSDSYTTFRLNLPEQDGETQGVELCTLDGYTYLSIPADAVLPEQPEQITLDGPLELTLDMSRRIINQSRYVQRLMEQLGDAEALHELGMVQAAIHVRFAALNAGVNTYICDRYDMGTQASFLSLHGDPDTPQEVKAAIKAVWDWIRQVLAYYYGVKGQVLAGDAADWDFSQFDEADPGVQLSDFMGS